MTRTPTDVQDFTQRQVFQIPPDGFTYSLDTGYCPERHDCDVEARNYYQEQHDIRHDQDKMALNFRMTSLLTSSWPWKHTEDADIVSDYSVCFRGYLPGLGVKHSPSCQGGIYGDSRLAPAHGLFV